MLKKSEKNIWNFMIFYSDFYSKKWIVFWDPRNFAAVFFQKYIQIFFENEITFFIFLSNILKKWFDFFWFYIFFISIFFKNMIRFSRKMILLFWIFVRYFSRKWNHFFWFFMLQKIQYWLFFRFVFSWLIHLYR